MIHEDLVSLIVTTCGSLVSDSDGDRVFPNHVPPKLGNKITKRPLIRYQKPDDKPVMHMLGRTETQEAVFELECQADTYGEVQQLRELLVTAFDDCPKQLGTHYLKRAIVTDSSDQFEPNQSGKETGIHKAVVSVDVVYQ